MNSKRLTTTVQARLSSNSMDESTNAVSSPQDSTFNCLKLRTGSTCSYPLVLSVISFLLPLLVLWITKRLGESTLLERCALLDLSDTRWLVSWTKREAHSRVSLLRPPREPARTEQLRDTHAYTNYSSSFALPQILGFVY
jgi:hypothetical protein